MFHNVLIYTVFASFFSCKPVLHEVVVTQSPDHLQRGSLFEMLQSGSRVQQSAATALFKVSSDLLLFMDWFMYWFDWTSLLLLMQLMVAAIGLEGCCHAGSDQTYEAGRRRFLFTYWA